MGGRTGNTGKWPTAESPAIRRSPKDSSSSCANPLGCASRTATASTSSSRRTEASLSAALILRMPQGGSTEGIDLPLGQMGANSFRKEICLYCENLILRKSELPEISSFCGWSSYLPPICIYVYQKWSNILHFIV